MAIIKKPYEISIWSEILGENGQKIEHKDFIIGAHDMEYLGRATSIKFEKKLNGTHTLTFSLPDRWFDSKSGTYVRNEFIDQMYNERKVKFFYKGKWYEFYVKSISDSKIFKSYMKTYSCSDAFIDELSRNGYGLTFDEELYNNVEEIGDFTEEILEDSVWYYAPENNWGDFTECLEEKLFKIPVSQFQELEGYKLTFEVENSNSQIINAFTNEKRKIEISDDLARKENLFWDQRDGNHFLNPLINLAPAHIKNDGYIYVPYSQLNFCYKTTSFENSSVITATEEPCFFEQNGEQKSYAIAPPSIDPTALIQFIAIPENSSIEIDEAGTIVSKEYSYVMTVEQWNRNLKQNKNFYQFEPFEQIQIENGVPVRRKIKRYFTEDRDDINLTGNYAAYYEGYLNSIGDVEVSKGKKISITDRTEINITKEIDQYVKVYNNLPQDIVLDDMTYMDLLDDNKNWIGPKDNYRICSKEATRQVVPQLARNLIQNGVNIRSTDGWEVVKLPDDKNIAPAGIKFVKNDDGAKGLLKFTKSDANEGSDVDTGSGEGDTTAVNNYERYGYHDLNTVINFGIVGQGIQLSKEKIYVLGIKGKFSPNDAIIIGEGSVISSGDYKVYWEHMSLGYTGNFYSIASFDKKNRHVVGKEIQQSFNDQDTTFIFIKPVKDFLNPYIGLWLRDNREEYEVRILEELWFFEAYTKGKDQFLNGKFKYSGRDICEDKENIIITEQNYTTDDGLLYYNNIKKDTADDKGNFTIYPYSLEEMKDLVLFEDDIAPGDVYAYQQYFIQQVAGASQAFDTFKHKKFLSENPNENEFNSAEFTEDDLQFNTAYFNLNKCPYYKNNANFEEPDCCYNNCAGLCMYQKYGYCPYLFQSEKHCRKIRTLKKDKSNRFNLTQELSKIFEVYPMYYTNNDEQGRILKKKENYNGKEIEVMDKRIFYITEKGKENKLGFRYEKNLSNISRTLKSDQIVSKLYVQDVDSELSKTGLCSIKTAEDNPSKDNFILDFSYYISKGLIDEDQAQRDLYGIEKGDMGFLKQLGYYNSEYDKLSNLIINLQSSSYTELEANVEVNFEGIISAKQQVHKLKKQLAKYNSNVNDNSDNSTIKNTIAKYQEQIAILNSLYDETFNLEQSLGHLLLPAEDTFEFNPEVAYVIVDKDDSNLCLAGATIENFKDTDYYKNHTHQWGMLGQFNREYRQIQEWKKTQATYLKKINELSLEFFRKYEPYIKEGTWTDSNYLADNAYYFGALEVAAEGAIPKVSYTITTVDLSTSPQYSDNYTFEIADTTYIEDIGMFGINQKTGLPNRLKVLISGITENPDEPAPNSITVQNFTTQFEDLFKQVSSTVQSLTYNENIYKRSSNFTSNQNIKEDSLQGTLDSNSLTLLNTSENNIELNAQGQAGSDINNHTNKYKLNGQGLFFSNNGGQTWNTGVGPSGINADYIKVGSLDAGKIKIVDNDFLYFYWDRDGIVALREPQSTNDQILNSYAMFNRYGLSLVENGKIKLRAGYEFNSPLNGKINTETQQSNNLGFYLYDNSGQPIFKTESSTTNSEIRDKQTARLSLRGEMFITDGFLASAQNDFYALSALCELEELPEGIRLVQKPNDFDTSYATTTNSIRCYFLTSDGYKFHVSRGDCKQYQSTNNPNLYLINYLGQNNRDEWFSVNLADKKRPVGICVNDSASVLTNITDKKNIKTIDALIFLDDVNGTFYGQGLYVYEYNGQKQYYIRADKAKNIENSNTIGLYLNNKMENGSIAEQNGYVKRILSCVKEESGNLNNILSILQNGSLYIGGTVKPQYNNENTISKLSDLIQINDAGIELIKQNGQYQIRMNFANFKDQDGNDLATSISGTAADIDNVKHKINEIIERINQWNDDWFYGRSTTTYSYDIGQLIV